jgi:hypothetical protein
MIWSKLWGWLIKAVSLLIQKSKSFLIILYETMRITVVGRGCVPCCTKALEETKAILISKQSHQKCTYGCSSRGSWLSSLLQQCCGKAKDCFLYLVISQ